MIERVDRRNSILLRHEHLLDQILRIVRDGRPEGVFEVVLEFLDVLELFFLVLTGEGRLAERENDQRISKTCLYESLRDRGLDETNRANLLDPDIEVALFQSGEDPHGVQAAAGPAKSALRKRPLPSSPPNRPALIHS